MIIYCYYQTEVIYVDDILTRLYYLLDEFLPTVQYPNDAEQALAATLTPEQMALLEEYQMEVFRRDDAERRVLFTFLVKLGLHVP